MDAANGSYGLQYNTQNDDDLSNFFNDVSQYANNDYNPSTQFDPALFAENSLASFTQQPSQISQPTQSTLNQSHRQTHSQSPALPQFKSNQATHSPAHYGQNMYNQQSIGQGFDPSLLSRPTPSPGPFDNFTYQNQQPRYGHPSFDYGFNSFQQQQRQSSTTTQAFRPQINQQTQHYLNAARPSAQPQAHISQVQTTNGISYPLQQGLQMSQRFIEPSMLGAESPQTYQGQTRQSEASPYFTMANSKMANTLDPQALQMQQHYNQLHQLHNMGADSQQASSMQSGQLHNTAQIRPQIQALAPLKITPQPVVKKQRTKSGSASSSDDGLEIEEDPEPRPAPITLAKPTDERGKLMWEVLDAVWTPRNRPASPDKIRSAVSLVGTAIRGLRDKWKQTNEQLKQAELPNSTTKTQAEGLKEQAGRHRETMEALAGRVTRFGHPSILKRLGENQILLSALYSFLLDRVNAEDYNSTLVVAILQLGTKFHTVDEEQLEKVKWTKILQRFAKKSTNDSKVHAQQILNNSKNATIKKRAEAAGQAPASPSGSSSGQVVGIKRAREGSDGAQQIKKVAIKPSSKPLSVQLAEQKKLKEKEKEAATKSIKADKLAVGSTRGSVTAAIAPVPAPAQQRVAAAMPTKTNQFTKLMSASKRPGTTNADRAKAKVDIPKPSAPAVPVTREPLVKAEVSIPKPTAPSLMESSFLGGLLADMSKPKEAPKIKTVEDPNETPEVRRKRLKRETRGKLRVSWKPDSELVQTRVFMHDPDEETGYEDSMMRDVGDTGKEGEMLKHRVQVEEEEDDSEDDDEIEYHMPSEVDYSVLIAGEDNLKEHNYAKAGGSKEIESPASKAQDEFERGTMMRIWAAGEQPNTPKEPLDEEDDDFNPVRDFGEPQDPVLSIREREKTVLARRQEYQRPPQPQSSGNYNLSAALASILPQQTTKPQQQDWLQALGTMTTQQMHQNIQAQTPNLQGLDMNQLMQAVAAAQQNQPPSAYHVPAIAQSAPPVPMSLTPNLAALLGGLQSGTTPLPTSDSGNPNPFPGAKDSKRGGKDKKKTGKVPTDSNGLPLNYKTRVCDFWLQGLCTKGDACTYKHERDDVS